MSRLSRARDEGLEVDRIHFLPGYFGRRSQSDTCSNLGVYYFRLLKVAHDETRSSPLPAKRLRHFDMDLELDEKGESMVKMREKTNK